MMPALQVRHHGNGSDESGPDGGWGLRMCVCVDGLYMDIQFCGGSLTDLCVCSVGFAKIDLYVIMLDMRLD